MSNKFVIEEEIARVGGADKEGHSFTADDLRLAADMDDDLVFDEKSGILKLVLKGEGSK